VRSGGEGVRGRRVCAQGVCASADGCRPGGACHAGLRRAQRETQLAVRRARIPNEQLAELLAEAGCSRRRLACYVVELGRARGFAGLRYDHSSVLRWLAGEQPRAPVPALVAEVISGLVGRVVTPAELGMQAGDIRPGLGAAAG